MSAEHNHAPRCCCRRAWFDQPDETCPGCPQHGALAVLANEALCGFRSLGTPDLVCDFAPHSVTQRHSWQADSARPYTEQETTK